MRKKLAQSKEEYVAFIKFTGRLHELLTEIMENIDKCYSLQVMPSIPFSRTILSIILRLVCLRLGTNFQVIIIIGGTFTLTILTMYAFYRYHFESNDSFEQLAYSHLDWQIYYVLYTLFVIYGGSILTKEVNIEKKFMQTDFISNEYFF